MKTIATLAVTGLCALGLAIPASALQPRPEVTGDRINVLAGLPSAYPAGQPFHVAHGWTLDAGVSDYDAIGKWSFALDVDGLRVEESAIWRGAFSSELTGLPFDILARQWVFNFADGLPAGTHTFIGHWSGPCQAAVDSGIHPGPCARPTEVVELLNRTLTVTFEG